MWEEFVSKLLAALAAFFCLWAGFVIGDFWLGALGALSVFLTDAFGRDGQRTYPREYLGGPVIKSGPWKGWRELGYTRDDGPDVEWRRP